MVRINQADSASIRKGTGPVTNDPDRINSIVFPDNAVTDKILLSTTDTTTVNNAVDALALVGNIIIATIDTITVMTIASK